MKGAKGVLIWGVVLALALAAPWLLPAYKTQLTFLWIFVLFALTWDVMGGQMGYNSFGNILFFGLGMYVCAAAQVGLFIDLAAYTAASGAVEFEPTPIQYFTGLGAGLLLAAVVGTACAAILGAGVFLAVLFAAGAVIGGLAGRALGVGPVVPVIGGLALAGVVAALYPRVLGQGILGLRGHYFAIGTLGLGFAAGEIAGGWDLVGAGSGLVTPLFPAAVEARVSAALGRPTDVSGLFYYYTALVLAALTFFSLAWLYRGRFGLALNAIRDDEEKAEAMGLHTTAYKTAAWCVAALFLALAGGLTGNVLTFIDPRDVAFAGGTFGVWMVLMAILGGRGTLWGPVVGAVVFHVTQEILWTQLLGWQRVAMGLFIVLVVVFFPQGIVGWVKARWPALAEAEARVGEAAEGEGS